MSQPNEEIQRLEKELEKYKKDLNEALNLGEKYKKQAKKMEEQNKVLTANFASGDELKIKVAQAEEIKNELEEAKKKILSLQKDNQELSEAIKLLMNTITKMASRHVQPFNEKLLPQNGFQTNLLPSVPKGKPQMKTSTEIISPLLENEEEEEEESN